MKICLHPSADAAVHEITDTDESVLAFLAEHGIVLELESWQSPLYFPHREKYHEWPKVIQVRARDYTPVAYVDRLPDGQILQPSDESRNLYEMIGEYSQNYLECSYNEDEILEELIRGTLDENIKFRLDHQIIVEFERKMGDLYRADGTYAAQLFDAVIAAGGWARNYMEEVVLMNKIPGLTKACADYLCKK